LVRRKGLLARFGPERVRDTPISETAFIGAAVGLAAAGMKPVVELMFVDFFGVCMDSIYNLAAKAIVLFRWTRYMSPGADDIGWGRGTEMAGNIPSVVRYFCTPARNEGRDSVELHDAKRTAARCHPRSQPGGVHVSQGTAGMGWLGTIPRSITHVPEEDFVVPIGRAAVVREGDDVTSWAGESAYIMHWTVRRCWLRKESEPRCWICGRWRQLDRESILRSVRKTGRLVVIDDDYRSCGVAAEVIASVCETRDLVLHAAPSRVTFPDVPIPFAPENGAAASTGCSKVVSATRAQF